jgi:hypothetical protein
MNELPDFPDLPEEAFERLQEMVEERRKQRMTEAREWPPPEATVKEWDAEGLKCAIARGQALCGYVHVPADHPDAKLDYDDVGVEVHGGLTFRCKAAEGGVWFGFDCAHHSDWFGFSESVVSEEGVSTVGFEHPGHIWTVEEVTKETERLAKQFAERAKVNTDE